MKVKNTEEIISMVQDSSAMERHFNFSIAAHINHGKTTISDFLLKAAGLMRPEDAGLLMALNNQPEEEKRGITIYTHVLLLSFDYKDQTYLFEIHDTPGHLSFTGEVSRALRGSDGAVIVVDALEGVMTQTETNVRLSVGQEKCRPILFINKVDRLITQLKLEPKEVYARIDEIVDRINDLIRDLQPEGMDWTLAFANNQVAVGAGKDGWAFNMESLKMKKIKPNVVFEKYAEGDVRWLRENLPLDEVLLRMVIQFLPNPLQAAPYRMPFLAPGVDKDSELYQSLITSNPDGPLMGMFTKVFVSQKDFRPVLIGRVFSGTLHQGDMIRLVNRKETQRITRLGVMEIQDILDMDYIPAGNLFAVSGFICTSGETFVEDSFAKTYDDPAEVPRFESIKYSSEPVCSRSVKPKDVQDLPKFEKVISMWTMADNTSRYTMNKESGEFILSGIDPLQIEILTNRIKEQVDIVIGEPIIVYREMMSHAGDEYYTKSPNGHNRILMHLEPLEPVVIQMINDGTLRMTKDNKEAAKLLHEKAGWDAKEGRKIWDITDGNMLVDDSHGLQRIDRIKGHIIQAFHEWVEQGPLAKEPVTGVKCVMSDCTVHVDPAHTGYGEIATMVGANLALGFLSGEPILYEPVQKVEVKVPLGMEGGVIGAVNQHRGQILDVTSEGAFSKIKGKLPTSETIDIADDFRDSTEGRAFFGYEFIGFEPLPTKIQEDTIMQIRERKKMPMEMPDASSWKRFIYVRT